MRITFTATATAVLSELEIGAPVMLRGHVVEIREERIDVMQMGSPEPQTLPGEREFTVEIESVRSAA